MTVPLSNLPLQEAPPVVSTSVVLSPEGYDPSSTAKVPIQGRLRRLLFSVLIVNFGIFVMFGAVPTLLLPLQVQGMDPANAVANLAFVSTAGAITSLIAQPLAGMLSDRTRSRFGRRAPLAVSGILVGGLALVGMGLSSSIAMLCVAWVITQIGFSFAQAPLSAILPDRVPRGVRGTFSAVMGLALMLGVYGGLTVGALFARNIPTGYFVFAGVCVIIVVLFFVFNPDNSNTQEPRPPFSPTAFLANVWVNPRRHPDFFFGFAGRLLLYTGYYLVYGYQLYIVQDYIGLGDRAIVVIPLLGLSSAGATVLATLTAGVLSDRLKRRKIIVLVGGSIMAAAMLVPFFVPTVQGMFVWAVLMGLGFGAYQSVDTALVSEVLPSKLDFGKDLGIINIAVAFPQVIAPALAGAVVLSLGFGWLFVVGSAIVLVGAVAVLPIRSVR